MFDNIQFLTDLNNYCKSKKIKYIELTYTEQLAVIRSMLCYVSRSVNIRFKNNGGVLIKK